MGGLLAHGYVRKLAVGTTEGVGFCPPPFAFSARPKGQTNVSASGVILCVFWELKLDRHLPEGLSRRPHLVISIVAIS